MSSQELSKLSQRMHRAAFLVAQAGQSEEAHGEILRCIVELEQLRHSIPKSKGESGGLPTGEAHSLTRDELDEVAKAERKLSLWSQRPSQVNTQILVAFLKARRDGVKKVTEQEIRSRLDNPLSFGSNFAQMKIIAPKNHCKIFEQNGVEVSIWEPVREFVEKFEASVLNAR